MLRSPLLRGVSACAFSLATACAAQAQQSLPTIEVGASRAKPVRQDGARRLQNGGRAASVVSATASRAAEPAASPANDPMTYNPPDATTALKTTAPIMQTPVSVQVVPRQIIRDQQITTIGRAVENVSGVISDDSLQAGNTQSFFIRGFNTNVYYRDGVRVNSLWTLSGPGEMANVDSVEVLKGPASILYGRAEPGGLVNIVTKPPQATPSFTINQQFGSWSYYRTTLDATGPITKDDTLLYRFNFALVDSNSFRDLSQNRSLFIAPTLRWNIDASTQVNAYLDFKHAALPNDTGAVAFTINDPGALTYGPRPLAFLPRGRNFGESWAKNVNDDIIFGINWSHAFNENWTLRHRFQGEITDQNNIFVWPQYFTDATGAYNPANPTQLARFTQTGPTHTHTYFTNADLAGKFDTFGVTHNVLLGGDFQHFDYNAYSLIDYSGGSSVIDLFNPIYASAPPPFDPNSRWGFDTAFRENWYGFYVQDQMKLPYNFSLLAGGRYDHANTYDVVNQKTTDNAQRVTPRVGILWQPVENVSVYGSYVTNFGGPNISRTRALPSETAQQWEAGVKTQWLDKRLTATIALYELTKQNVAAPDPIDPTEQVAIGEVRNKGVELDVAGELAPGWKVIASYSYINSLITKDRGDVFSAAGDLISVTGNQGNRLYNVPRHSGSLWMTYEFKDGDWKGLKVGGGSVARDIRQGNNQNTFQLPGYATIGLMAAYDFKILDRKVHAQFNVDNLLDTRYYPTSSSQWFVRVGSPRTFRGEIGVAF